MDYKEVKKKNGQVLIFCNFEELLKDFYKVDSMEEVEPFVNSSGEYIIHCPFCRDEGHTKHKLYIKSDLTVGHCFVCTRDYVNISSDVNVSFKVPDYMSMFNCFSGSLNLVKLNHPVWNLDKFKYEFDDYSEKGVNYLINRNPFLGELYKVLDFKFMDDNIVMPFKYHGEIFYYQIRFTGNSNIRYYFPPISDKPPYIIEHGDNKKFVIVEGVYDAVAMLIQAPEYTPFAVLGSSISDYQLEFLREYSPIDEIVVFMDDTEKSNKIARKVMNNIGYCPINIIPSNGEDPEEKLIRYLRNGMDIHWINNLNNRKIINKSVIPKFKWPV